MPCWPFSPIRLVEATTMSDQPYTLRRFGWGLAFVAAFTLLGQFLEFHGLFVGAESWVSRSLLAVPGASPRALPVVVIEIDDDSYHEFFGGKSPLNPQRLLSLVEAIGIAFRPAVIGVDLLTEEADYSAYQSPQTPPVVWATWGKASLRSPVHFGQWLLGHDDSTTIVPGQVLGRKVSDAGPIAWGIPIFDVEEDGTVRRVRRTWTTARGNSEPNVFARKIVNTYCEVRKESSAADRRIRGELCEARKDTSDEFFLRAAAEEPHSWKLTQLFDCFPRDYSKAPCNWESLFPEQKFDDARDAQEVSMLTQQEGRPIVLLGGTYAAARDSYASLRAKGTPGVMLNARAVQIELEGNPVTEFFPRWVSVLVDYVVGCVPLLVFGFLSHPEWIRKIRSSTPRDLLLKAHGWNSPLHELAFGSLLLLGQIALSVTLFYRFGSLWLSWVPALLSGFAWQFVLEQVIFRKSHASGVPA
jgi:CHASE2 domain